MMTLAPCMLISAEIVKAGNTLNRYYVATRYPDSFASGAPTDKYFEQDAKEAVGLATAVHDFARATISPSGPPAT